MLQKKYSTNQLIGYIILFIILVLFLSTIGVNLLVNTALFVSNLGSDKSSIKPTQEQTLFETPQLYNIPEATNSAILPISGFAPLNTEVTIYVNNNKQAKLQNYDSNFDSEIMLQKGKNSIYIEASNKKLGYIKQSRAYHTIYITEKPILEITSPQNNDKTFENYISVNGVTEEEESISINGLPVVVDANGNFSANIKLQEGENKIIIKAVNIAGTTNEKTITIIREIEE